MKDFHMWKLSKFFITVIWNKKSNQIYKNATGICIIDAMLAEGQLILRWRQYSTCSNVNSLRC